MTMNKSDPWAEPQQSWRRFMKPTTDKVRWYQFSLRRLLAFMLVAGLALGWIGRGMYQEQKRREAAAPFRGLGGAVLFRGAGPFGGKTDSIVHVNFDGERLSDAETKRLKQHLEEQPTLRSINFMYAGTTDTGLQHLKGLTWLQKLDLSGTQVTDAGLEHLEGLTSLTHVKLHGTRVTDEGVQKLQEVLPNCKISH